MHSHQLPGKAFASYAQLILASQPPAIKSLQKLLRWLNSMNAHHLTAFRQILSAFSILNPVPVTKTLNAALFEHAPGTNPNTTALVLHMRCHIFQVQFAHRVEAATRHFGVSSVRTHLFAVCLLFCPLFCPLFSLYNTRLLP